MRKSMIRILLVLLSFSAFWPLSAQIKGLLEKEQPSFFAAVTPAEEEGAVWLSFYFTHSKATVLEASLWLKDQGPSLAGSGVSMLVRGLQTIGNRQQDSVLIRGLRNGHFYTFGIDYKTTGLITSKFETQVLIGSYRYEYTAANTQPQHMVRDEMTRKSGEVPSGATSVPCNNPNLFVQVENRGYCSADDRPAVLIQCVNCERSNWEFSVEMRNANTQEGWQPLRYDGRMQSASGNAPRTEPLCNLRPGVYYVRVVARGENCPTPVIHNVNVAVPIADRSVAIETPAAYNNPASTSVATNTSSLPDTCVVRAWASLVGNAIRGTIELAAGSPCAYLQPFAEVRYVHPGYRDITAPPVKLVAGSVVPFEILLDERDLNRNIQTLQVISFVKPNLGQEALPMAAFWIKAGKPTEIATKGPTPGQSNTPPVKTSTPPAAETFTREEIFEPSISQDIETISVKASDPNCTPIQELSLVYMSGQPDKPLYISWLNPRCCQTEGCKYSIWSGENPDRLRILVDGSKRGAVIKELLPDMLPTDRYIEIVVSTSNGNRKAAYVLGEGPKYGIEEILAYRDRLNPPKSDPVVIKKETNTKTGEVSGDLVTRGLPAAGFAYTKPQNPIDAYQPCKYQREILMVGDQPTPVGKKISIQYDFSDKDYRYTLYLQPEGATDWVLAPGTEELQKSSRFDLNVAPYHAGKYVLLVRKANSTWGCLAMPLEKAIEVKVMAQN